MTQPTQEDKILFGQALNLAFESCTKKVTFNNERNPEWEIEYRANVKAIFEYQKQLRRDYLEY